MEEKPAVPGIAQVCILFSIVVFLFLMIGYRVQKKEFYSGILITEVILIMLPALIYLMSFRIKERGHTSPADGLNAEVCPQIDVKRLLRLNKTSFLNFILILGIMIFALPLVGLINFINLWLVNSIFGKIIIEQPPVAENFTGLLVSILVIGGSAGLCEEFLFRGVIQRGLERFGAGKAILLTAFLFGLTHLDFQKLFGAFLLGSLIGFIVYRTNSLYSGIFAHFTNNTLAVVVSFAANKVADFFKGSGIKVPQSDINLGDMFSMFGGMSREQLIIIVFVYGILFFFFFSVFALILFALTKLNPRTAEKIPSVRLSINPRGLLWLLPGVSFIALMYFAEVMSFRGINNTFVEQLRMLLGV